jgi:hypothetical protein
MATFRVVVDDPDMGARHDLTVTAASRGAALFEAAAQAILVDRLGCGAGLPEGFDRVNDTLPMSLREQHADDAGVVEAVARYAAVEG